MGDGAADAIRKGDFAGAAKDAARTFELNFARAAKPKATVDTNMARDGESAGDSFASGFGSAAGLAKLAGRGGPVAGAIIASVAAAVKVIRPMVEQAMAVDASIAMAQARGGVSDRQMRDIRKAATGAWGNNWGPSIQANADTAVTALQSGLGADQATIESLTAVSQILGEEIPAAARSAGQLIRTGLAQNAKEAFDIIVAAQREGLNVSGDLLDSFDEYSTKFRDLGLSGADAIGLISQMLKAGVRDTDKASDLIKEFSIRAIDGSKATTDAYITLGLNAAEMSSNIAAGGETARAAFDTVIDRIRGIKDPVLQMQTAVALMGTTAEDAGAAFKAIDLTTAANSIKAVEGATQSAADTALKTSQNEWQQAGRNIEKVWQSIKDKLQMGRWGEDIAAGFNAIFFPEPRATLTPGAPGVPGALGQGPGPAIAAPPGASSGGNPLDIFAPRGGAAPPPPGAPPAPGSGMWWGPNITRPADNPRFGSQYSAGSGGGGSSSGPTLPVVPYPTTDPRSLLPAGHQVTSGSYSAAQSVIDAQHAVAQKNSDLQKLIASTTADAEEVQKKRNELVEAEQAELVARMRLNENLMAATTGMADGMKDISSSFAEIGAGLDADLGFSKGLGGLADNLVRFLANLATAPLQGVLSTIANGGRSSGSGGYGFQSYGVPSFASAGGYPGDAALLANVRPGRYSQAPDRDLLKGLSDCSSSIGDLVNMLDGRSTGGPKLTTGNAAQWLPQHGFMPGKGGPGDFRVGYNSGHMQATLPGGTPWNWGSDAAAARGGVGGTGAADPAFTDHWYRPASPSFPTSPSSPAQIPTIPSATSVLATPSLVMPTGPSANTNPGLTPGLPAPGTVPTGGPLGTGFPSAMTASYAPDAVAQAPNPNWTPQGGGNVGSGLIGMAMSAAGSAASLAGNAFAPGSGQAAAMGAQMAQKAIERTISFGGQIAGTVVSGIQDSLSWKDPDTGQDPLANSWLQRLSGALMGARPAGSINAGKADKDSRVDPNAPQNQQQNGQQQQQQPQQVTINNNLTNGQQRDNPQQLLNDLGTMQQNSWFGGG